MKLNQDQLDFVTALNTVDRALGEYASKEFRNGASFDKV